jgi:hypothetical protein
LEEFVGEPGNGIPPYAILSHRWGREEVSFRDMTGDHTALAHRKGFQKIVQCCAKAKSEGHNYVWIDTCCIDKSGSAELSEAINSMFHWYREAEVCYAYLDDVYSSDNLANEWSLFKESRWFTRGWTLQELLAPYEVVFLTHDWQEIGTKRSLSSVISSVTKIDKKTLNECTWNHASIACKMSWASSRNTTRVEDEAYSLMGLFDVNMPLIYGEGQKAFYRLQLEIMKSSDDHSIFAWAPKNLVSKSNSFGFLARSPKDFQLSHGIMDCAVTGGGTISYDVSKQDVRLELPMLRLRESRVIYGKEQMQLHSHFLPPNETRHTRTYLDFKGKDPWDSIEIALLPCKDELGYIGIPLRRLKSGKFERFASGNLRWLRTHTNERRQNLETILVRALGTQKQFLLSVHY